MNAFFYWSSVVRLTYPSSEVRRLVSLSIIGYDRALLANDRPQFFRSIPLLITSNGVVLRALTLCLRSARLSHIYPLSSPRVSTDCISGFGPLRRHLRGFMIAYEFSRSVVISSLHVSN